MSDRVGVAALLLSSSFYNQRPSKCAYPSYLTSMWEGRSPLGGPVFSSINRADRPLNLHCRHTHCFTSLIIFFTGIITRSKIFLEIVST
jgi:hypothetical protein